MKMKIQLSIILTLGLLSALVRAEDKVTFKDQKDKTSYAIGSNIGGSLRRQEADINFDTLIKGMKDGMDGKSALTDQEMREVMTAWQRENRAKQEEKRKQLSEKNKAESQKFFAENKTKDGVITLPSGLQYKVLVPGQGESPKSNDVVTVNYRGTLLDGTEFDSSYKRSQPAKFAVNGVIKGWSEALQLMKPGSKWQLFIPSELGYGEHGSGQLIGPSAALKFEVELLSSSPPTKPAAAATGAQPVVTSDIIKVPSKQEIEKGAKIEVIKAEDVEKLQKQKQDEKK
ncbi:MAG TPA: FKBP-type peptidyl-prolyl cis-trans isomerase [Candidatus Nitrosotalea sp.]|nr:FKBP-type peptidyl-prolyl cis-trans isomerase [Candidatus Nitrosotalea sp.]